MAEGLEGLASAPLPATASLASMSRLRAYPAVSKGAARFRMQAMAKQNIADAVARLHRAFDEASREHAAGEPVRLAAVA